MLSILLESMVAHLAQVDSFGFSGLHQKTTPFLMQITFYCNRYFQNV
jgi:hypothetical protein